MPPRLTRWPPALRYLASQLLALGLLLGLARLGLRLPAWGWVALQGGVAAGAGGGLGLAWTWIPLNLGTPALVDLALRQGLPAAVAPAALLGLALVFGGGLRTRVPLYHSNRYAWRKLGELLPPKAGLRFLDLGAGFGGPLAYLARLRPDGRFEGVEASPLSWAVAALRCLPHPGARVRLGSLWAVPLQDWDVVYAFLSPVPMAELWAKVRREMRPGTVFISHTFEVPGVKADACIPLQGREDACLWVYVVRDEG